MLYDTREFQSQSTEFQCLRADGTGVCLRPASHHLCPLSAHIQPEESCSRSPTNSLAGSIHPCLSAFLKNVLQEQVVGHTHTKERKEKKEKYKVWLPLQQSVLALRQLDCTDIHAPVGSHRSPFHLYHSVLPNRSDCFPVWTASVRSCIPSILCCFLWLSLYHTGSQLLQNLPYSRRLHYPWLSQSSLLCTKVSDYLTKHLSENALSSKKNHCPIIFFDNRCWIIFFTHTVL